MNCILNTCDRVRGGAGRTKVDAAVKRIAECGRPEQLAHPARRNRHQRECLGVSEIVRHVRNKRAEATAIAG